MILIDTSAVIGSFAGTHESMPQLIAWVQQGTPILLCTLVLFEWQRGPRTAKELSDQELFLPTTHATAFGVREAAIAARIYRDVKRPRGREMDIAIAACAMAREIPLWTLNRRDFADIRGLKLAQAPGIQ